MPHPAVRLLAVLLLITVVGLVHAGAKVIVSEGFGIAAIIIAFASIPFLKRYLD